MGEATKKDSSLEPKEGTQPCRPISTLTPELKDSKSVFVEGTAFTLICYKSDRKLIIYSFSFQTKPSLTLQMTASPLGCSFLSHVRNSMCFFPSICTLLAKIALAFLSSHDISSCVYLVHLPFSEHILRTASHSINRE